MISNRLSVFETNGILAAKYIVLDMFKSTIIWSWIEACDSIELRINTKTALLAVNITLYTDWKMDLLAISVSSLKGPPVLLINRNSKNGINKSKKNTMKAMI